MTQAVVFLARGEGGGLAAAQAFFASYRRHPAGCAHQLIILTKGWDRQPGLDQLHNEAALLGARTVPLPDDGLDWGAYFRIAGALDHDWLCAMNTHSRICADGWLEKLRQAAEGARIGMAGATGSWGTMGPNLTGMAGDLADLAAAEGGRRFRNPIRLLGKATRFGLAWLKFPPFPNAHLRSNAFLIRRDRFLDFARRRKIPGTKEDAHQLESGRRNLTRFLAKGGLAACVVDRQGATFEAADWPAAATFRIPGQAGLLIADNQTLAYDQADRRGKRLMERAAWGRSFTA